MPLGAVTPRRDKFFPSGIDASSVPVVDGKTPWKINRKHTEALTKFIGKAQDYTCWKSRMEDHIAGNWITWRSLLDLAEKSSHPITRDQLQAISFGSDVTGWDLAMDLLIFVSKWVGHSLYERRNRLLEQHKMQRFRIVAQIVHRI